MRNILAAFLIVAAVVFAGCIGQPTTTTATGNGVIISSFSSDFAEVRSGEEATLMLSLANVGESDATGVTVQLFGLNFGANDWAKTTGSLVAALPTALRGANPSAGLAGDTYDVTWGLKAPVNLRVDNTYTADARVNFLYKTTAVSTIRFVSNDYIKSLPTAQADQVRKTAGVISSKVSNAPVQLSSTVGTRPLIVYNGGEVYTISLVISNAGSGNAFKDTASYPGKSGSSDTSSSIDSKDLNLVKVTINTDANINCKSAFESTLSPTEKVGYVSLNRGKSKTLSCSITAPASSAAVGNTKDYTINTQLNYGYFVDSSTSIKVLRTEETTTQSASSSVASTQTLTLKSYSIPTKVIQGNTAVFTLDISNTGTSSIDFQNIYSYVNDTSHTICTQSVHLEASGEHQYSCSWDTTSVKLGTYTITINTPASSTVLSKTIAVSAS